MQECGTSGSKQEDTNDGSRYWHLQGRAHPKQASQCEMESDEAPVGVVRKGSLLKVAELCSAPSAEGGDQLHKRQLKDPGIIHPSVTPGSPRCSKQST